MQALPCSRLETAAVAFSHEKGSPGHESSPDGGLQAAPGLRWSCLGEASTDFRLPANRFLAFFDHSLYEPEVMVHLDPPVLLTSLKPVITLLVVRI